MRKSPMVIFTVLACLMVLAVIPGAATVSAPVADGFAGPLQIAVGQAGGVYVAQDFAGVLTKLGKKGDRTDLVSAPGSEVAGVAAGGNGTVFYTTTFASEDGLHAELRRVLPNGSVSTLADIGAYEASVNPDRSATYGFVGISADCAAQLPEELGPPSYTGIVDSHPYAVALAPGGTLVADAAGNDILRVSPNGRIETVAVLPPQPVVITAEAAEANGLPACTVGLTFHCWRVQT